MAPSNYTVELGTNQSLVVNNVQSDQYVISFYRNRNGSSSIPLGANAGQYYAIIPGDIENLCILDTDSNIILTLADLEDQLSSGYETPSVITLPYEYFSLAVPE